MAYVSGNGRSKVVCDTCRTLIDHNLSRDEYNALWGKEDGDYCTQCDLDRDVSYEKIIRTKPRKLKES